MYENYAKIRDERGLSDYKVAKDVGIMQSTLSAWKKKRINLSSVTLQKLAQYLEVGMDALMGTEEPKEDKYWLNPETAEIAQEIYNNKELRLLFSSAKDSKPEDLKLVHNMLLALKQKERGESNG